MRSSLRVCYSFLTQQIIWSIPINQGLLLSYETCRMGVHKIKLKKGEWMLCVIVYLVSVLKPLSENTNSK